MLITFEGIDGCGKSTQMDLLRAYLLHNGRADQVINTREPGFPADDLSALYRHLIVEGNTSPIEKLFLLLTDRTRHYQKVIRPIFFPEDGNRFWKRTIVLSDRGPDSAVAYQGYGHRLASIPFIVEANRLAMQETPINLTIVLDVDPKIGLARVSKEQYFEKLGLEYFERVRKGYHEIARVEPQRVVIVNSSQSKEETHSSILRVVKERLNL